MWGLEEVFGEGIFWRGSAAGGYGGQPLKAGGAAQPGGCSACFVPVVCRGPGGAVPERMRFWAREWVVSGRDGTAGDCVAMVQESWETCSNGAVLLLKMVVWGGVATWNVGFLSQRCLGCVGDLGVRGLDWDVSGWRGVKRIRVLVVGPGLDVGLFIVRLEAVGLPGALWCGFF